MLTRFVELYPSPRGIEEAVRTRIRRRELLYGGGRRCHVIWWELVLRALACSPSVLAAQLDRLTGVTGMNTVELGINTVELGIVPLTASLKSRPA
ncbi:Scr1 family TA system antitoxin-like transcriptional regulator [Streptomyces huasconensis]|uniref:Scr1 family TA system antitoxin-like transcriptional regulator n=1 Tax=Streptomyces huasconensis TaxID=1854574 RepID=UPI0036FCDFDB